MLVYPSHCTGARETTDLAMMVKGSLMLISPEPSLVNLIRAWLVGIFGTNQVYVVRLIFTLVAIVDQVTPLSEENSIVIVPVGYPNASHLILVRSKATVLGATTSPPNGEMSLS